jgi:hypothetical protein
MTASELPNQRSRRAVLTAAMGGVAVLALDRLGRPAAVKAAPTAMTTETFMTSSAITALSCTSGVGLQVLSYDSTGLLGATNGSAPNAGVYGLDETGSGYGVLAKSNLATGTGLRVEGKASFNRSGRAKVAAGKSSVDVTVPGGLGGTPLVFANLTSYRAGVAVAAVRPNYPSSGKARIYLTKAVPSATYVAWFVAN